MSRICPICKGNIAEHYKQNILNLIEDGGKTAFELSMTLETNIVTITNYLKLLRKENKIIQSYDDVSTGGRIPMRWHKV